MLIQKIKDQLLDARKSRNELVKNVLSVVLGDIQSQESRPGQKELTDQQIEKIIQKLIKANMETMEASIKLGSDCEKLNSENKILKDLLPRACTREEIVAFLNDHKEIIKSASSDGQATGVTIKLLFAIEGSKDGKLVAEIVKEIRS